MKKDKISTDKINNGFSSALSGQLIAQGFSSSSEDQAPAAENKVIAGVNLAKIEKLVLRREKKGRGGKTVTVVSGFNMQSARLEELARTMRKALGSGSTVEEGTIILQGDITDRARTWLEKQGAKKIIVGN